MSKSLLTNCSGSRSPVRWVGRPTPWLLMGGSSLGNCPPSQSELEDSHLGRLQVGSGTQVGLWICPWYTADVIPKDCQPESLSVQAPIEISLLPHFILVEGKWCLFLSELSDHTNHLSARLPASEPSLFVQVLHALQTVGRLQVFFCLFIFGLSKLNPLKLLGFIILPAWSKCLTTVT